MNIAEWLEANPKILERFAELIAVNGGQPQVKRICGQPEQTTDNRYGRRGLTIHEAIELAYVHGGFDIIASMSDDAAKQQAWKMIMNEIAGEAHCVLIPTPEQTREILQSWRRKNG